MRRDYNLKLIKETNMYRNYKILKAFVVMMTLSAVTFAGNPDRQGEAGAVELLLNPWARSSGLHTMNTSSTMGIEAMRLNIAGLGRITSKELVVANTRLYEGSTLKLNAIGYGQRMGKNGAIGISLMSIDFGDIDVTTENSPGGTGSTFSPSFFNLGIGYSHTYENKISVGILFRAISESLPEISAFGFAIDAGVQYVSGPQDNFRLGISLRNVGSPMQFSGEALSFQGTAPGGTHQLTFNQRASKFELPSVLNIGVSYDFYFGEQVMLRGIGNFTSNAFSKDQVGAGVEVTLLEKFTLRGAYKRELGEDDGRDNLYTGLAAGASIELPLNESRKNRVGIDYAYRATNPYRGTHNISFRLSF